jgi:hypothetical protein
LVDIAPQHEVMPSLCVYLGKKKSISNSNNVKDDDNLKDLEDEISVCENINKEINYSNKNLYTNLLPPSLPYTQYIASSPTYSLYSRNDINIFDGENNSISPSSLFYPFLFPYHFHFISQKPFNCTPSKASVNSFHENSFSSMYSSFFNILVSKKKIKSSGLFIKSKIVLLSKDEVFIFSENLKSSSVGLFELKKKKQDENSPSFPAKTSGRKNAENNGLSSHFTFSKSSVPIKIIPKKNDNQNFPNSKFSDNNNSHNVGEKLTSSVSIPSTPFNNSEIFSTLLKHTSAIWKLNSSAKSGFLNSFSKVSTFFLLEKDSRASFLLLDKGNKKPQNLSLFIF